MLLGNGIRRLADGGGAGPRDEGPAADDEDAGLAGRGRGRASPPACPSRRTLRRSRDGAGPCERGPPPRSPRPFGPRARPADRMSRSRHIDLDTSETVIVCGADARARHRAAVEEQLAAALAAGDGERVSQLREQLKVDD